MQFIPLFLFLLLLAAFAKLAARIFRRSSLSWRDSFYYSLLVGLITVGIRAAISASGIFLPIALGLLFGIASHLMLGGWFFGTRVTDTQGQVLGWRRGLSLTAIMLGLLAATALASFGVVHILTPISRT